MSSSQDYHKNTLIQLYMNNITSGSREDRVNHLWAQILSFYWPIAENYAIERETYPAEHVGSKADIVLTTCVRDRIVKALFVECKRHARNVTGRAWDRSKSQLTSFIRRWEQRNPSKAIYGLLCIGKWVRFFKMPANQDELVPFPNHERAFSVKSDATEIDSILREIREAIRKAYT